MKWPTSRQADKVDDLVGSFDSLICAMLDQLTDWHAEIAAGAPARSGRALQNYQRIVEVRNLGAKAGARGLADAYLRQFPDATGFDPVADWPAVKTTLDDFITWFQGAWPKSPAGDPAAHHYGADGGLGALEVALTAPQRTQLLARIDAVLGAFQ
jgi:hypothetical protein